MYNSPRIKKALEASGLFGCYPTVPMMETLADLTFVATGSRLTGKLLDFRMDGGLCFCNSGRRGLYEFTGALFKEADVGVKFFLCEKCHDKLPHSNYQVLVPKGTILWIAVDTNKVY